MDIVVEVLFHNEKADPLLFLACGTVHPFVISQDKWYLNLDDASFKSAETYSKQAKPSFVFLNDNYCFLVIRLLIKKKN